YRTWKREICLWRNPYHNLKKPPNSSNIVRRSWTVIEKKLKQLQWKRMISMNNRFSDVLHQKADLVNAYLDSKVSQKDNLQGIVYEAMRYSLLAGGKRIRPVLALAAGQVLGEQEACILP